MIEKRIRVGVEISRKCSAWCRHCITMAGPSVQHVAPQNTINRIIKQVSENKIFYPRIDLTGGESLLLPRRIIRNYIKYAKDRGVGVFICTNGFWGRSLEAAKRTLRGIEDCSEIQLCTDIFHQKFVPFESVINSARTCLEMGIKVSIRGLHYGFTEADKKRAISQLRKAIKRHLNRKVRVVSTPLKIGGRAIGIYKTLPIEFSSTPPKIRICSLLKFIFISSYGDVYPCCSNLISVKNSSAVVIGNINRETLDIIVKRARRAFLPHIIYKYGIKGLLKIIEGLKGKDYVKKYYTNIQKDEECQVCARIFEHKELTSLFGGMRGKVAF